MTDTITRRGPVAAVLPELAAPLGVAAAVLPDRYMVDSAYPMPGPPPGGWRDIILIYAGGDTPHPWTTRDILGMPARYRFPTWVRSNPQGSAEGSAEAAAFIAWLRSHGVPQGTCVVLDLEIAVATAYVTAFNLVMRAGGYLTTKYGSQDFIWQNPKTDGGTFIAWLGGDTLTGEGDEVARQYAFDGAYDLSVTRGQDALPLWDTHTGQPLLRAGFTGYWVGVAQIKLNAHGASPKLVVDDDFGNKTYAAVQAFQTAQHLTVDGIIGPLTWAALNK